MEGSGPATSGEASSKGQVAGYDSGAATIRGELYGPSGSVVLAEGSLNAGGDFEIFFFDETSTAGVLMSPDALCEGITISPEDLKVGVLPTFAVSDASDGPLGQLFEGSGPAALGGQAGEKVVAKWYADRDGSVTGTLPCGHDGKPITFALDLQRGWNAVIVDFKSNGDEEIRTGPKPDGIAWHFVAATDAG